jgi:hypothetical protein
LCIKLVSYKDYIEKHGQQNINICNSFFLFSCSDFSYLLIRGLLLHLITHWPQALGRTALDERSARRRDLYLTAHNTRDKQPCPDGIWTHSLNKWAATVRTSQVTLNFCFLLGKFRFQISTLIFSVLISDSHCFIQCLHTNSGVVPQIRPRPLPFALFRDEPVTGRSSPDLPT